MNQLKSKEYLLRVRNLTKRWINSVVRLWYARIPEVEAQTRTSKLTKEVFNMLKQNLEHQNEKVQTAYKDGNFPRLLEFMEKLVVFMVETDNHYEKHLGYFYIMVMLKMNRYYETWKQTLPKPNYGMEGSFNHFVEWFLNIELNK